MTLPVATIPCGTDLITTVHVKYVRQLGCGGKTYAGGWITGFTGHENSLLSSADMRKIAAALIAGAEKIEESGLPSFQEIRDK